MHQVAGPILALLGGVAFLMLGNGALGSLIGLRLAAEAGPVVVGLVTTAYFGGVTAGSLYAYGVVARVGHIRAFSAFASVLSAASLAHALAADPLLWAALRLMEGFCMAGLFICVESWLNDKATNETRGQVLSLYMVTLYGAMAAGQQLLNLDDAGAAVFMAVSILLSLALVPVALTRTTPPVLPDVSSFGLRRLYRASPLGVAGVFVSGAVSGAVYGLGPVFATASGFEVSGTALFMTVLILGGVALQWPFGRLSDRFDRRAVLVGLSAALVAASLAMVEATGLHPLLMLGTAALFGGISFTLYPVSLAHTNDHVERADLVSASGGLILANSMGAILGPLLASAAMAGMGPRGLFAFTGAAALAATLYGLWRTRVRPPVPAEAQGRFRPMPQTTPVAAPLDPRPDAGAVT
ncbi:MAG TPA: MFS transporter [Azospirillum sp.]